MLFPAAWAKTPFSLQTCKPPARIAVKSVLPGDMRLGKYTAQPASVRPERFPAPETVFVRGVYVDKNTFQPANV